jgi:DNA-directed RNA polymerase specialized sigma24 family protein
VEHIEAVAEDVHRFVSRRVANCDDAADISQEVLTIACANVSAFAGELNDECLFAIARGLIVDYDRTRNQIDFVAIDPAVCSERESALRIPPDSVVAACDIRRRVNSWLCRCDQVLEPGQQVAVLLADIYGYADKDSAAMLGMSVSSFKTLLHTSRARLKTFEGRSGGSLAAIRKSRIGVVCHIDTTRLQQLRDHLVNGLRLAMLSV